MVKKMSEFSSLITDAEDDVTSDAIEWLGGHACVFVTGDFGHVQTRVVIEASVDNSSFCPIDGLDDISDPVCKYFHMTGHAYIRAKVTNAHHSQTPNISVRLM